MTFGASYLVCCPTCRTLYVRDTIGSYTSFTEELWSDGFRDGDPVCPESVSPIVYCPRCAHWFWIEDAPELFGIPPELEPRSIPIIEAFTELEAEALLSALEQNWDTRQERKLRLLLLWEQNHPRRDGEDSPVSREFLANIERLCDIVDPADEPLLSAELFRELGEFDRAVEVLSRAVDTLQEPHEQLIAARIEEKARSRSTAPFEIPNYQDGQSGEAGLLSDKRLREAIERGFYPFPPVQDVLAFPTESRIEKEEPILLVRLEPQNHESGGWVPILGRHEDQATVRFSRVFREDEWKLYERSTPRWQKELRWFWSIWSINVESGSETADRYYRVLFQLHHDMYQPGSDYGLDLTAPEEKERFLTLYRRFSGDWGFYRLFWDYYWSAQREGPPFDETITAEELTGIERQFRASQDGRRLLQGRAQSGLEYFETEGPCWFQDNDMTPIIDGHTADFVGQVWLDYLSAGTTLVYLFYERKTGTVVQVYDYD
jgi:hypothetical protein